MTAPTPTDAPDPHGPPPAAPSGAVRRGGARDVPRRTVVLAAVLMVVAIAGGTALVAAFYDDSGSMGGGDRTEEVADDPQIIPRPNEGRAPEEAGDRGGWAQLSLLALLVAALGGIAYAVVRGTRRSRANREAWLAAARTGRDGVLDDRR